MWTPRGGSMQMLPLCTRCAHCGIGTVAVKLVHYATSTGNASVYSRISKDLFTVVLYFSTRPWISFDKLIPKFLIYFEENYIFWFSAFPIYSCWFFFLLAKEKENYSKINLLPFLFLYLVTLWLQSVLLKHLAQEIKGEYVLNSIFW